MSNKAHPIIFGLCVCGIIILVLVIIIVVYSSMNRDKKEGFRRLVLNRFIAGGSNPNSGKPCGRQFRGNEIQYLLKKDKLPEDWYKSPKDLSEITNSDITKEIADKTLNEITEQTGVDVRPEQQMNEIEPRPEMVNPSKPFDTANKINEDRTVETNVGKPVNGPVMENFNELRISAFNKKPTESLIASSNPGEIEPFPTDLAMKRYARQNFK